MMMELRKLNFISMEQKFQPIILNHMNMYGIQEQEKILIIIFMQKRLMQVIIVPHQN